ncbi:MAG: FkbM family methyltransferase [Candidatus Paceibacterota bacterium]
MLIEFGSLQFPKKVTGVIHIGAHECEEYELYLKNFEGVKTEDMIWIEALPHKVQQIKYVYPNMRIFNQCISDKDGDKVSFMVTNNGQSSSMLEFGTHSLQHPGVVEVGRIELTTKTLDTFCADENLDMSHYNFMNLDIQGAEYLALKGASKLLENVDYIYSEVNADELYKGCLTLPHFDQFLLEKGFKRVNLEMTEYGWGDAFYSRC